MCFHDIVFNHPFVLKSVLLDVWQDLPSTLRDKLRFHTVVYHPTDLALYQSSGFADGLPFVLDGKRGYRSFVRFLAECDGIINLTAGSILGRITFLSAALGRPGIFSDNSQLNARLYPGSQVTMFDTVRLRELLRAMLLGLASGATDERLLPSQRCGCGNRRLRGESGATAADSRSRSRFFQLAGFSISRFGKTGCYEG